MEKIILIGAGGHAKTIVDTIERQKKYQIEGFIDIDNLGKEVYRSYKVIGHDEDLESIFNTGVHHAAIAIGYMGKADIRNSIYNKLKKIGYSLPIIIDNTAIISDDAKISEGTYIGRNAVVNADANIGKVCIINTSAIVEHECLVGDFTHIAVGAVLCGRVKVGCNCLVGANATVLQMLEIGDNTIVGAGSILTKNIGENLIIKNKRIEEITMIKHFNG